MIRILLVDDDCVDREISEYYLKKLGDEFELVTCGSSLEALECLRNENLDCVVSDLQMPEMNGLELLTRLRTRGETIPFIILSGQNEKEVAIEAFSADADDYFPKDSGFALYERLAHSIKKVVKAHKDHLRVLSLQDETKAAREKLQNIQKSALLGSWEFDVISQKIYCCPLALQLMGMTEDEFDGTLESLKKNSHPEDLINLEKVTIKMNGGASQFAFRHRINLPGGSKRVLEVHGKALKNSSGKVIKVIGTNQDVTTLHNLEESLKESYARFKESFAHAAVGMVLVDMDKNIVEANEKFCDMFSFQVNDLINKSISEFSPNGKMVDSVLAAKIEELFSGEISSFTQAGEFVLNDGSVLRCDVSSTVIKDKEGVPQNFLAQFIPR